MLGCIVFLKHPAHRIDPIVPGIRPGIVVPFFQPRTAACCRRGRHDHFLEPIVKKLCDRLAGRGDGPIGWDIDHFVSLRLLSASYSRAFSFLRGSTLLVRLSLSLGLGQEALAVRSLVPASRASVQLEKLPSLAVK
jgi:hypothetical protein